MCCHLANPAIHALAFLSVIPEEPALSLSKGNLLLHLSLPVLKSKTSQNNKKAKPKTLVLSDQFSVENKKPHGN
jgi:hypothetical protein